MHPKGEVGPRRIVLVGLPYTGKSVVARAVAERLGWQAIDCDELIVREQGRSIPDIFRTAGEGRFREIEREVVARVAATDRAAIATGGGSVLSAENRRELWHDAFVVELRASPQTLLARLSRGRGGVDSRPLLTGSDPGARLRQLASERATLYGMADWSIQTDGLRTGEVADEVIRAYSQFGTRLVGRPDRSVEVRETGDSRATEADVAATVQTAQGSYEIAVGWNILAGLGERLRKLGIAGRIHVITDDHVGALYGEAVTAALSAADYDSAIYELTSGEDHKTLADAEPVFDWLVSRRAERREAIVAVGGGVVTDLAGFVAATFLRGVPVVHVPTSLLGAVDAAIGGKVAVDHQLGKNLIGAFYQPRLVLIDAALLQSLPARELTSGWAEVIKHGLITDAAFVSYLEEHAAAACALERGVVLPILRRSVQIKAAVVSADERESGPRSTLNYGHTIGHALEAAEGYTGPLHGEAVAVGMAGAGAIGRHLKLVSDDELERQNRLIAAYGLPLSWPGADLDRVIAAMALDKKTAAAAIRWVMLDGIGKTVGRADVQTATVRDVVGRLVSPAGSRPGTAVRAV